MLRISFVFVRKNHRSHRFYIGVFLFQFFRTDKRFFIAKLFFPPIFFSRYCV